MISCDNKSIIGEPIGCRNSITYAILYENSKLIGSCNECIKNYDFLIENGLPVKIINLKNDENEAGLVKELMEEYKKRFEIN